MAVIKVDNITKDYGDKRGVFNASFEIGTGEVFGFLGPNGAGKTTAIRQLLGFIKPDNGSCYINGEEVWEKYYQTNADIGYLSGEINFPEKITGTGLIEWIAALRGMKGIGRAQEILDLFELKAAKSEVKKMSKGMKQKIGIVTAFMHDPKILILDEPTSGLDPLMQDRFVELVRREKQAGKTILMSSHMFAEVEKTCDRVAIIKQGEIVAQVDMADISKAKTKTFKLKFAADGESKRIIKEKLDFVEINHEKNRVKVRIEDKDINTLTGILGGYKLQYISEVKQTLEGYFMRFYSNTAQN
jgi:ABC-2 type transport system ATP-binding protein